MIPNSKDWPDSYQPTSARSEHEEMVEVKFAVGVDQDKLTHGPFDTIEEVLEVVPEGVGFRFIYMLDPSEPHPIQVYVWSSKALTWNRIRRHDV